MLCSSDKFFFIKLERSPERFHPKITTADYKHREGRRMEKNGREEEKAVRFLVMQ